jgi:hypothetical protein
VVRVFNSVIPVLGTIHFVFEGQYTSCWGSRWKVVMIHTRFIGLQRSQLRLWVRLCERTAVFVNSEPMIRPPTSRCFSQNSRAYRTLVDWDEGNGRPRGA